MNFKAVVKTFLGYEEQSFLNKFFDCVVLIEKLKETRVFKGFSRINPNNKIDKKELSNEIVTWLPAVQVFGEGIFLKFKDDIVDNWLGLYENEFESIVSRFYDARSKRGPQNDEKQIKRNPKSRFSKKRHQCIKYWMRSNTIDVYKQTLIN